MTVIEKIEAQQKGKENTAPWMVGEQLKEMCRDPQCAQLLDADLDNPDMSLEKAERQIKAWADGHKRGKASCVCVPPNVAEEILRKFYGLPPASDRAEVPQSAPCKKAEGGSSVLDLSAFL